MDFNQLEAFLTAQTTKQGGITSEQAAVISKFWKSHKIKIRESLMKQSRWDNGLRGLSWRVDGKSQSRHSTQIHSPVAIIELEFGKNGQVSPASISLCKLCIFIHLFYFYLTEFAEVTLKSLLEVESCEHFDVFSYIQSLKKQLHVFAVVSKGQSRTVLTAVSQAMIETQRAGAKVSGCTPNLSYPLN